MLVNGSPFLLQWFPLEGVESGEVHLKLQWFSLKSDPSLLTEVVSMLLTFLPPDLIFINIYIQYHQALILAVNLLVCLLTVGPCVSCVENDVLLSPRLQTALLVLCLQCIWTMLQTYR